MNTVQPRITKATLERLQWPTSCVRTLAVAVIKRYLESTESIWFDSIGAEFRATASPRILCAAWRGLVNARVLVNTGQRRRSIMPGYMGISMVRFALASREIGIAFLTANGSSVNEMQTGNLFLESPGTGGRLND